MDARVGETVVAVELDRLTVAVTRQARSFPAEPQVASPIGEQRLDIFTHCQGRAETLVQINVRQRGHGPLVCAAKDGGAPQPDVSVGVTRDLDREQNLPRQPHF